MTTYEVEGETFKSKNLAIDRAGDIATPSRHIPVLKRVYRRGQKRGFAGVFATLVCYVGKSAAGTPFVRGPRVNE